MTPYQIKRSLLYHAIQGKLVSHKQEEGTGAAIIEENYRKRQTFSPEIQKRIGKGCRPIKEGELPFEIPDSWEWERFGNLVINYDSQRRPVTKSDRKTTKGLYDYYGATGAIDRVDEYIFDGEYLMIGEDGGNFFVDRDNSFIACGQFWANNHVHVVTPILCSISYLKICLDAYDLPNMGLINGIAVPKLNQENMNSILIPVPPLAEQKRIVAKIEELLPLIDRYEQAWTRLEDFNKRFPTDMQKSLLQLAIQGKLVEQRPEEGTGEELAKYLIQEKQRLIRAGKIQKKADTKPFLSSEELADCSIPDNWTWVQLSDVSIIQEGAGIRKWQYRDIGTQILCVTNILDGEIDLDKKQLFISTDEYLEKYQHLTLNRGDIVTACSGGSWGKLAFFDSDCTMMLNTSTLRLRFFSDIGNNNYLYYVCKSLFFRRQLELQLSGMQPNFGYAHYSRIMIPLPPLAEQKRIVAKLEELLPLCDKLK